jgi:hypothetical protein
MTKLGPHRLKRRLAACRYVVIRNDLARTNGDREILNLEFVETWNLLTGATRISHLKTVLLRPPVTPPTCHGQPRPKDAPQR